MEVSKEELKEAMEYFYSKRWVQRVKTQPVVVPLNDFELRLLERIRARPVEITNPVIPSELYINVVIDKTVSSESLVEFLLFFEPGGIYRESLVQLAMTRVLKYYQAEESTQADPGIRRNKEPLDFAWEFPTVVYMVGIVTILVCFVMLG